MVVAAAAVVCVSVFASASGCWSVGACVGGSVWRWGPSVGGASQEPRLRPPFDPQRDPGNPPDY